MASQRFRELCTYAERSVAALNIGTRHLKTTQDQMIRIGYTGIEVVWYERLPRLDYPGWVVREREENERDPNDIFYITQSDDVVGAAKHLGMAIAQRMIEERLDSGKPKRPG